MKTPGTRTVGANMVLLAIVCVILFLLYSKTSPAHEIPTTLSPVIITLTDKGFKPNKVTIKQGTPVAFKTTRTNQFWPASNNHPQHEIYPEFDPRQPLEPYESWTFNFNEVGTWRFHDHIRSYFTGIIHVIPK